MSSTSRVARVRAIESRATTIGAVLAVLLAGFVIAAGRRYAGAQQGRDRLRRASLVARKEVAASRAGGKELLEELAVLHDGVRQRMNLSALTPAG